MNLMDQAKADLEKVFFNIREFGIAAVIGGSEVKGIFSNAYAEELEIAGSKPIFIVGADDAAAIDEGDTAVIGGKTYHVDGIEPDKSGLTNILMLKET